MMMMMMIIGLFELFVMNYVFILVFESVFSIS